MFLLLWNLSSSGEKYNLKIINKYTNRIISDCDKWHKGNKQDNMKESKGMGIGMILSIHGEISPF